MRNTRHYTLIHQILNHPLELSLIPLNNRIPLGLFLIRIPILPNADEEITPLRVEQATDGFENVKVVLLSEVVVVVAVDEVNALGLVDGLFVEEGATAADHNVLEVLVLFGGR